LVKRTGEEKGYRATIKKESLRGLGNVDVALEKDGHSIACEIAITSTVEQVLGNIEMWLAGGFERVTLISSEEKLLKQGQGVDYCLF
jgi:hypothetical protein